MGKNSKRRKQERKTLRQSYETDIKLGKQTKIANSIIPAEVAIGTFGDLDEKLAEESCFRLIFSAYHHGMCGLTQIEHSSDAKALIKLLDKITTTNPKTLATSHIVRDNVKKDGPYKPLFTRVPEDTELKEAEFADTGRLFFYTFNSMFCVVAITINHL